MRTYTENNSIGGKQAYWIVGLALAIPIAYQMMNGVIQWPVLLAVACIVIWVFNIRLRLAVSEKGVSYQLKGLQWKKRFAAWSEIESWKLRKISPLLEFGGWGLRLNSQGWGYITSSKWALVLRYKSGKTRTISVERPDKIQPFLRPELRTES